MSLEKAEEYLKNKGMLDHVIRLEDSTATVVEAFARRDQRRRECISG